MSKPIEIAVFDLAGTTVQGTLTEAGPTHLLHHVGQFPSTILRTPRP